MRKLLTITAVFTIAVLFTSCRKQYTCTCTYHYPGDPDEVTTVTVNSTKSKAQSWCTTIQTTNSQFITEPGESYTCHL